VGQPDRDPSQRCRRRVALHVSLVLYARRVSSGAIEFNDDALELVCEIGAVTSAVDLE
jgi:hypothetical protein